MSGADETSGGLDRGRVTFERPPREANATSTLDVALTETELRALCWALDNYLPELRYEEVRVKRDRGRHDLVAREELLSALRERFAQALVGAGTEPR
jgi:hypothetical protein